LRLNDANFLSSSARGLVFRSHWRRKQQLVFYAQVTRKWDLATGLALDLTCLYGQAEFSYDLGQETRQEDGDASPEFFYGEWKYDLVRSIDSPQVSFKCTAIS
jgi:hypothetical protein